MPAVRSLLVAATLLGIAACGSTSSSSSGGGAAAGGQPGGGQVSGGGAGANNQSGTSASSASSGSAGGAGAVTGQAEGAPTATLSDPCKGVSFGPALTPKDQPADVHTYPAAPAMSIDVSKLYLATLTTGKGAITLCLQPTLAPGTVGNFVALARNHFYDGLTFHRVVPGFVVQAGDPKGDGSGGPGYQFPDEPVKAQYRTGAVAMANAGPDTNGSQFFICISDGQQCASLSPKYNLFGIVHDGQAIADAIKMGEVISTVTVAQQS